MEKLGNIEFVSFVLQNSIQKKTKNDVIYFKLNDYVEKSSY